MQCVAEGVLNARCQRALPKAPGKDAQGLPRGREQGGHRPEHQNTYYIPLEIQRQRLHHDKGLHTLSMANNNQYVLHGKIIPSVNCYSCKMTLLLERNGFLLVMIYYVRGKKFSPIAFFQVGSTNWRTHAQKINEVKGQPMTEGRRTHLINRALDKAVSYTKSTSRWISVR